MSLGTGEGVEIGFAECFYPNPHREIGMKPSNFEINKPPKQGELLPQKRYHI
jgi:hypothetical protein